MTASPLTPAEPNTTSLTDQADPNVVPRDLLAAAVGTTPAVHAVVDANGVVLRHLLPGHFTNIAAGRVGVLARPGMRRATWLANDILAALGCSNHVTGSRRPGEAEHEIAIAWLQANNIRHLYVQYAWSIGHDALTDAVELARRAGCHLWLAGDAPYTEHHVRRLADYQPVQWTGEEFLAHWNPRLHRRSATTEHARTTAADVIPRDSTAPDLPLAVPADWPGLLPADDFTTFRSACRDHLTIAQFKAVDDYLIAAHHLANTELVPLLAYTRAPDDPQSEEATNAASDTEVVEKFVADWLAAAWEETPTLQHYIVLLRGAQVAAFNAGFYLQVDLDQLIATADGMPRRALRSPAMWARLHAYPEPHRGAVCALAAAGMSLTDMGAVAIGCWDGDTGVATVHDRRYHVDEHAGIFLTAQQRYRRLHGAGDDDLLFARPSGTPYAARAFATIIKTTRRELGVAVAPARIDRTAPTAHRWTHRWGVSIQELL